MIEDACQRRGMGETRPQDRWISAIAEFNFWYSLPMAPPAGPPVGHKLRLTRNHRSLKVVRFTAGPTPLAATRISLKSWPNTDSQTASQSRRYRAIASGLPRTQAWAGTGFDAQKALP